MGHLVSRARAPGGERDPGPLDPGEGRQGPGPVLVRALSGRTASLHRAQLYTRGQQGLYRGQQGLGRGSAQTIASSISAKTLLLSISVFGLQQFL